MTIQAISTRYAGCHFRSRLEARWAVFFDTLQIGWEYEPEGYVLTNGTRYLPDFLLPECGTWIEVKGSDQQLNRAQLILAVNDLPNQPNPGESGPKLILLGPIPEPTATGDWGWLGGSGTIETLESWDGRYGFGMYHKNGRPWWLDDGQADSPWTSPTFEPTEHGVPAAYAAARSARFEHDDRETWQ